MLLKYFYDPKLAHASYLVGCQITREAIVIDPGRKIEAYLKEAKMNQLSITAVTETHIHADFVSGTRELAERTGATIFLSGEGNENWQYRYPEIYQPRLLKDGDVFNVGNIWFEAIHTPGHTPEHLSFLLTDRGGGADRPMGIFTGDFVFAGAVGRPDLLEKAAGITGSALAGARAMFQSIQRFKQLPDYLQVWPGHGAGSACGKGLGAIPSSTVGYEKQFNPALAFVAEPAFVDYLLTEQPEPPKYFAVMKRVNREGPCLLHHLSAPTALPASRLPDVLRAGAMVVDTRPPGIFAAQHVPGTINIPTWDLAAWAGWFVNYDEPLYLIVNSAHVQEAVHDMRAIGIDQIAGYFSPQVIEKLIGMGHSIQHYETITPSGLVARLRREEMLLIDVRSEAEWQSGYIPGAQHIMLGYLPERSHEVVNGRPIVVTCRSGRRSAIGASILQAQGAKEVFNLQSGIQDWIAAGLPFEK